MALTKAVWSISQIPLSYTYNTTYRSAARKWNPTRFCARRRTVEVDIFFPVIVAISTTALKLSKAK